MQGQADFTIFNALYVKDWLAVKPDSKKQNYFRLFLAYSLSLELKRFQRGKLIVTFLRESAANIELQRETINKASLGYLNFGQKGDKSTDLNLSKEEKLDIAEKNRAY